MSTLASCLHSGFDSSALVVPGKHGDTRVSHRDLARRVREFQLNLAAIGITHGSRVAFSLPNSLELIVAFFATTCMRAVAAPLNFDYKQSDGGSVIVPQKFSASEFWKDFIDHSANWYTAVPTIHQILLKNPLPSPRPAIRFIRSCSSPLPPTVLQALEYELNTTVLEAYAMTEAAHQICSNPLTPGGRIPGSVGIPQGVELHIKDDAGTTLPAGSIGEVCIRGANVTSGYLVADAAVNASTFTADGFLRTGDQGVVDGAGYVRLTGRIKELINKGGEKISPIELDNLLLQHPDVGEAVSFALDDALYGQDVGVAVVRRPGARLAEEDVKDFFRARAAKFKVPKRVYFTETMPKTATGKIQRRQVAATMIMMESLPAPVVDPVDHPVVQIRQSGMVH
ncbi:putative peroxisomal-coenzyme a synthetase protein [Neofusicoccum parvum UCRNP2]|uniref:Putative peroxisomal-coenzyme a synthetase protein n=1 Tax=Botryosphaeria parva (strain UCR-NP2) TaxID=1287680 RepID=R1G1Q7_BOTPV|nr:putative peroxisomal-coenzyme a synthetase protein [Neofusicoccum parvum UCRNP2]